MTGASIRFPHLGIVIEHLGKSISIFGFDIAYYGIIIGVGMLCGIAMAVHEAKRTGQNPEMYYDFALCAIISAIVGCRIYYVAFEWSYYSQHPLEIFNLRQGGLAIYGGIIGGFICMIIFSKIRKASLLLMADTVVPGIALGQIIGRWGNFFNREVFGEYTDNLFAMRLPIDAVRKSDISASLAEHIEEGVNYIQVHPTFLYEGMWNLLILVLLLILWKHKHFDGEVALLYFGGYGLGRFFIEGIRTDQLHIGNTKIAVSQLLGILLFVAALVVEIVMLMRIHKKKAQMVKKN